MATSEANSWSPLKVSATFNPVCILLSKLLLVGLPIAQISIGTIYLKECTQQNYIPVYVLVSGVFSLCLTLLSCLPFSQKDSPGLNFLCSIWNSLVSGFILCWFIAGSVWIYSIYPANYNSTVVHIPKLELRNQMAFVSGTIFVCSSIFTGRIGILLSLLPTVITGLGARHIHDCPKQPMIPVYLLVGGIVCLILQILPYLHCFQPNGQPILLCKIFKMLLLVFCPIWLLTGTIFIYMAYEPKYEFHLSADYSAFRYYGKNELRSVT
ncbi:hypothetical protein HF521_019594 [Silurus meridionalis]|uniref:Uncharacterized protein n=1 Tax=Silurus meridionalis TaxID=175797 RepID=A0A8T0BLT6_SILME|nr:hypothetical protein HF521_019594 [Silurus meridionalis]